MDNPLYYIIPLVIFFVAWPIIYLIKYGGISGGFKRTSDEDCSQGIYIPPIKIVLLFKKSGEDYGILIPLSFYSFFHERFTRQFIFDS